MQQNLYIGTIARINAPKGYSWISGKSVVRLGRNDHLKGSEENIFLHLDDCQESLRGETDIFPLRRGMQVVFSVKGDPKREGRFRAYGAYELVLQKPQVELHIDNTAIDNPTVPVRWCFTKEMHRRMLDGFRNGFGYSLLLVARRPGMFQDEHEIRELHRPLNPFAYVVFPKPGVWEIGLVLFERRVDGGKDASKSLDQSLSTVLFSRSRMKNDLFSRVLPSLDLQGRNAELALNSLCVCEYDADYGQPIAACEMSVSVPAAVFSVHSKTALQYVNYFFPSKLHASHDCQFRRRMLLMIPGFVPYIIWEFLKRLVQLLAGLIEMIFFLRGSPRVAMWAFEPGIRFFVQLEPDVSKEKSACYWPFHTKSSWILSPGMLVVWALAVYILYLGGNISFGWLRDDPSFLWLPAGGVFGGALAFLYRQFSPKRKMTRSERERLNAEAAIEAARRYALLAERQAPALVCGATNHQVKLEAIPAEMRTWGMRWTRFKRLVCRPIA